jgi:hypothetical protein
MFKQEQDVAYLFFFAERYELLLQAEARGVVDGAELDDGDQTRFAPDVGGFRWANAEILTREDDAEELRRSCASLRITFMR